MVGFIRNVADYFFRMFVIQSIVFAFIAMPMVWLLRYPSRSFVDVFPPDVVLGFVELIGMVSILFGLWIAIGKARGSRNSGDT